MSEFPTWLAAARKRNKLSHAQYARPALDKQRLGEIIDLMSGVMLVDPEHRTKDVLGRVYEYFLAKFASAEGRLVFGLARCGTGRKDDR